MHGVLGKPTPLNVRCIKDDDCKDLPDGDYASCLGCEVYASCYMGNLNDNRPCLGGTLWDDIKKACVWDSSTCPDGRTRPTVRPSTVDVVTPSRFPATSRQRECNIM